MIHKNATKHETSMKNTNTSKYETFYKTEEKQPDVSEGKHEKQTRIFKSPRRPELSQNVNPFPNSETTTFSQNFEPFQPSQTTFDPFPISETTRIFAIHRSISQ